MMAIGGEVDLNWMAGSWRGDVWGGVMEEHWTNSNGDTLVGMNRVVKDGKTMHREFLSIETRDGAAVMTVFIARKVDGPISPTDFTLTESEPNHVVFENPDHERLSRITYDRTGDAMHIRLEGKRNGEPFLDELDLTGYSLALN